jgi:hypothetical protein
VSGGSPPLRDGVVNAGVCPHAYQAAERLAGRRNRLPHRLQIADYALVAQAVPPAFTEPPCVTHDGSVEIVYGLLYRMLRMAALIDWRSVTGSASG